MADDRRIAVERQSPGDAFELLSDDLRTAIVQALGEADGPLSFSALRDAVDERDSGKFNYHLGKLVGHFVSKGEDGYDLTFAGDRVYGAIRSGAYTASASVEAFEFEGPCPTCGAARLVAEYADEHARLYCRDCGEWRNEFPFPPANLDQYDRSELPDAFDRWMRATVMRVLQGFCANCGGRIDGTLERPGPDDATAVRARFDCDRCGDRLTASPTLPLLFHPVAVSFFSARGIDVLHDPSWRVFDVETDVTVETGDGAPLRARVTVGIDGADLVATVGPDVALEGVTVD